MSNSPFGLNSRNTATISGDSNYLGSSCIHIVWEINLCIRGYVNQIFPMLIFWRQSVILIAIHQLLVEMSILQRWHTVCRCQTVSIRVSGMDVLLKLETDFTRWPIEVLHEKNAMDPKSFSLDLNTKQKVNEQDDCDRHCKLFSSRFFCCGLLVI